MTWNLMPWTHHFNYAILSFWSLTTSKLIHFDCNVKSVQDILQIFSFSVPWKKDKWICNASGGLNDDRIFQWTIHVKQKKIHV